MQDIRKSGRKPQKRPRKQEPTEIQRRLVEELVQGGGSIKAASIKAGYKDTKYGYRAARMSLRAPHVQELLNRRLQQEIVVDAAKGRLELLRLAQGARSEYVRMQAAQCLLERLDKLNKIAGNNDVKGAVVINIGVGDTMKAPPTIDITPPQGGQDSPFDIGRILPPPAACKTHPDPSNSEDPSSSDGSPHGS